MKKKVLLVILLVAIAGGISAGIIRKNQIKAVAKDKVGVELLYEWQNLAFEISEDYTHNLEYRNADELKLNHVAVDLCAYNSAKPESQLTVDEVVDYFSDEYDSNGELKVYSKPEKIHDYIDWYYHGGNDSIREFGDGFNEYLRENGNNEYHDLSYEETAAALEGYLGTK